jgi:hypothetical protein
MAPPPNGTRLLAALGAGAACLLAYRLAKQLAFWATLRLGPARIKQFRGVRATPCPCVPSPLACPPPPSPPPSKKTHLTPPLPPPPPAQSL